ncbi:hypothetical protein [uncultured Ruminococcus sp.]|uniref:hypothetical protein n=1 Tax=uncultured Ruminococcus sp. TaxID=165186 RepID=UPI0025D02559|nr:hypothetical protein [uncultured Ruminococcus sp.]
MKNDDIRIESELEKELKERMNGLSARVNCFEKISERAFPSNETDFEVVVSDVENVSGRFKSAPVLKIAAAAAAAVAIIAVIPRTAAFQNFLADVNEKRDTDFYSIVREIETETKTNTYRTYDIALSDYAKYNIMVNPFCKCPFRIDEETPDARVRLFVRTYNDVQTDQMYAVEYSGEYKNKNFIAAAETAVKFTDEELASVGMYDMYDNYKEDVSSSETFFRSIVDNTVENNFFTDRYGEMTGENGTQLTAAAYSFYSTYKSENEVARYGTEIIYFKNDDDTTYYYDISVGSDHEITWERSLYTDDSSALPTDEANDISMFRKIDIDEGSYEVSDSTRNNKFGYYEPYNSSESPAADDNFNTLKIVYNAFDRPFVTPLSQEGKSSLRIYIPVVNFMSFDSQLDPTINITIDENGSSFKIHNRDLRGSDMINLHRDDPTEEQTEYQDDALFDLARSYSGSLDFYGDDEMHNYVIQVDPGKDFEFSVESGDFK